MQPSWVEQALKYHQAYGQVYDNAHDCAYEHTHFSYTDVNGATTSYIQPHSRALLRPRVGMACQHCRHRKVRCDGQKPSCGLCTRLKRPCEYVKVTEEENAVLREKKRVSKLRRTAEQEKARSNFHKTDTFPVYHPYRCPNSAAAVNIGSTSRSSVVEEGGGNDRTVMLAASALPLPQVGCDTTSASVMQPYVYGGTSGGMGASGSGVGTFGYFDIGAGGGSRRASVSAAAGSARVPGAGYTYPRKPSFEASTHTSTMSYTVDSTTVPLQPAFRPSPTIAVAALDAQPRYTPSVTASPFDAPSSSTAAWWSPIADPSPPDPTYPRLNRNRNRPTLDLHSPLSANPSSFSSSPSCTLTSPMGIETGLPALDRALSSDSYDSSPDQHQDDSVFWSAQVASVALADGAAQMSYRVYEGADTNCRGCGVGAVVGGVSMSDGGGGADWPVPAASAKWSEVLYAPPAAAGHAAF